MQIITPHFSPYIHKKVGSALHCETVSFHSSALSLQPSLFTSFAPTQFSYGFYGFYGLIEGGSKFFTLHSSLFTSFAPHYAVRPQAPMHDVVPSAVRAAVKMDITI